MVDCLDLALLGDSKMTTEISAIPFHVPHFGKRRQGRIDAIVIHDTGAKTAESTLAWFNHSDSKVSAHYLVDRNGTIYECVEEEDEAWHAGISSLHGEEDVNDFSIGIELVDSNDADKYSDAQIQSLLNLVTDICARRAIPMNRIVGHCHVARGRKVDPGPDFPWFEFLSSVGSNLLERALNGDGDSNDD